MITHLTCSATSGCSRRSTTSIRSATVCGSEVNSSARTVSEAAPAPTVLARHLVAPLSLAVQPEGVSFVSQNFGGPILRIEPVEGLFQRHRLSHFDSPLGEKRWKERRGRAEGGTGPRPGAGDGP